MRDYWISLVGVFLTSFFGYGQTFEWVAQLSGRSFEQEVVADQNGNVYAMGNFIDSVDFDPGPNKMYLNAKGTSDIYVLKIGSNGDLIWAIQLGGSASTSGRGFDIDPLGNIYVSGWFSGIVDVDPSAAVHEHTALHENDAFITKFDPQGNLLWSRHISGIGDEKVFRLGCDGAGNVLVSGLFEDTAVFDLSAGSAILYSDKKDDIFILKLNSNGIFQWVRQIEAKAHLFPWSVEVDGFSNVYLTGQFEGNTDFDPSSGAAILTSTFGEVGSFILQLDSAGDFGWVKKFIGSERINALDLKVDRWGNSYSVGFFYGTADFDPSSGVYNLTAGFRSHNAFMTKLDSSGNFVWAKEITGAPHAAAWSIDQDNYGDLYITGSFSNTADFDLNADEFKLTAKSNNDVYVAKYGSHNGNLRWAINFPGDSQEFSRSIAVGSSGEIYTTGHFGGRVDFDPDSSFVLNLTSMNFNDVFIHKMSQPEFSIPEEVFPFEIVSYPVPLQHEALNIELNRSYQSISTHLRNINGQTLSAQTFYDCASFRMEIHQPNGIYFLEIQADSGERAILKIAKLSLL